MTCPATHITVCICTYKRPSLLQLLLEKLRELRTDGLFTYSIVVVDNDQERSAEPVVTGFLSTSPIVITYCTEPRQNIALARNKALENVTGEFLAFIDDDECPSADWLLTLFRSCAQYQVDGALGPVKPRFGEGVPQWVIRGKFYDRATYPTGLIIDWKKGRTGNVLLKTDVFSGLSQPFRPEFSTGEDQDFFRRAIESGRKFVWCDEAVAYEAVPQLRCNRKFMLRRALLRGKTSVVHPTFGARDLVKSIIAVPGYVLALPFALIAGQHRFMNVAVRLCDHIGRLLALMGFDPVSEPYVTE